MRIEPLADDYVKVFESPDPANIWCFSPGITVLPSGRLVATMDITGDKVQDLQGPVQTIESGRQWSGRVYTSDDRGQTWVHRADFPFMHARPFFAGGALYVLGHCNDLTMIRSDDGGETWSEPSRLTGGEYWHQAPANVHFANGSVYLVMEKIRRDVMAGWPVNALAPVLMRGNMKSDLMKRENWTFSSELYFQDVAGEGESMDFFGIPFFHVPFRSKQDFNPRHRRICDPIGLLETNVVEITDPGHYWYDPEGRTFHLWCRANTHTTGYAAILKVRENEDGTMMTMPVQAPSGKTVLFVPCPGGQMKFHIVFDEATRLYWLLSSQATDSMTRAELLPKDRYNLPNNERHRLQLHFSKNCIDWCFAGLVAVGGSPRQSRHYASMTIDGNDLHILSRSGNEHALSAHNGNMITFHTVKDFRNLAY